VRSSLLPAALLTAVTLGSPAFSAVPMPGSQPAVSASAPPAAEPPAPSEPPRGPALLELRERPADSAFPEGACSLREAVCVRSSRASDSARAAALEHAEKALFTLRALGLPAPPLDGSRGGGPTLDIYLDPSASGPAAYRDVSLRAGGLDRDSAFGVLSPRQATWDCAGRAGVARVVAEAMTIGVDASLGEGERALVAGYLATLVAPCPALEAAAVDAFQRRPENALTSGERGSLHGSFLFAKYLEDVWGLGQPGHLVASLVAIATQRSPSGPLLQNEPDVFDALRVTMRGLDKNLGDALLDFGVQRAFVGSRSDGVHLADSAHYGDFGRVRFDWSVPFGTLPRRLAPLRPLSSTGMTYLWLDLAGAPGDAELTFVFEWELPCLFRWALVKVDEGGAELGRLSIPGLFGATRVEQTVRDLAGVAGLVVVGVNVGDIDRTNPFDPDDAPFEPHAYEVTVFAGP
jgi:hypothetical protein